VTASFRVNIARLISHTHHFCVGRKVSNKIFTSNVQLVYVEGEDAEAYSLILEGRLASYSGLPYALKTCLNPHAGGYFDPSPLRHTKASMTLQLYRFVPEDSGLEDITFLQESLWQDSEFDLDLDGTLSYYKGQTRVVVCNIKHDLTDLNASEWMLMQCRIQLSGQDSGPVRRPSSSANARSISRYHLNPISSLRRKTLLLLILT
jgi:hypothetical protein